MRLIPLPGLCPHVAYTVMRAAKYHACAVATNSYQPILMPGLRRNPPSATRFNLRPQQSPTHQHKPRHQEFTEDDRPSNIFCGNIFPRGLAHFFPDCACNQLSRVFSQLSFPRKSLTQKKYRKAPSRAYSQNYHGSSRAEPSSRTCTGPGMSRKARGASF